MDTASPSNPEPSLTSSRSHSLYSTREPVPGTPSNSLIPTPSNSLLMLNLSRVRGRHGAGRARANAAQHLHLALAGTALRRDGAAGLGAVRDSSGQAAHRAPHVDQRSARARAGAARCTGPGRLHGAACLRLWHRRRVEGNRQALAAIPERAVRGCAVPLAGSVAHHRDKPRVFHVAEPARSSRSAWSPPR